MAHHLTELIGGLAVLLGAFIDLSFHVDWRIALSHRLPKLPYKHPLMDCPRMDARLLHFLRRPSIAIARTTVTDRADQAVARRPELRRPDVNTQQLVELTIGEMGQLASLPKEPRPSQTYQVRRKLRQDARPR